MPVERRTRVDWALSTVASLVGTLPGCVAWGLGVARLLPATVETRFAIGFTLSFVLWPCAACGAWLVRSGARAWLGCGLFAVGGAALAGWLT